MRFARRISGHRAAAALAVAIVAVSLAGVQSPARAAATSDTRGAEAPPEGNVEASGGSAQVAAPVVDQPRPFGYVLGDTLTQRVLLTQDFQPEALPPLERAGLWFTRRSSEIQKTADDRRWLVMEYQVVNAPQTLMTVNLPAVTLKGKTAGVLAVAEWPISVAPLTPRAAFAKGGLQELRPDHPAPMLPTYALQRQLEIWLTAFVITVGAWFGWWLIRSIRAAANQPFARALREIRQAGDDGADAWLAVHRAFDRTAGRSLQTSTLPTLFKQAPHFELQRTAIEQFYSQSNLRFFGGTSPPLARGDINLRSLATILRRLEKQHER